MVNLQVGMFFPCDFHKAMWDAIGDDLFSLASKVFSTGQVSGKVCGSLGADIVFVTKTHS
jgi:hypothetical protein